MKLSYGVVALAFVLSAGPAGALADEPAGSLARNVMVGVEYQIISEALALGTQCARAPAWSNRDTDKLHRDYETAKAYLEQHAPGQRIWSDFETFRLLLEFNQVGVRSGEKGQLDFCDAVAPAILGKYRVR